MVDWLLLAAVLCIVLRWLFASDDDGFCCLVVACDAA